MPRVWTSIDARRLDLSTVLTPSRYLPKVQLMWEPLLISPILGSPELVVPGMYLRKCIFYPYVDERSGRDVLYLSNHWKRGAVASLRVDDGYSW